MTGSLQTWRSALPLLLVLVIALTLLVFFLHGAGLFRESVASNAETLQLAPTPIDGDDGTASPPPDVSLEIVTLLPKDAIPAVFDPEFVSAEEADGFLRPEDQVMGVVVDGDARAYGTAFLSDREVVNDTVGGRALTVTW